MTRHPQIYALLALALAGCTATPAATPTLTSSAPSASVVATPSQTPTPTPTPTPSPASNVLAVGQSFEQKNVKLTVSEVKAQPKGNHEVPLVGAMAQACNNTGGAVEFSNFRWTAAAADGSTFTVVGTTWGNDPTPRYPTQQAVDNGQCVKGWLLFEVPSSIKIDQIRYSAPGDGTTTPMLATWKA
jgi:hypothetical protein